MPVLTIQPWSQFTPNSASLPTEHPETVTFSGGETIALLLVETATGSVLEQAVSVNDQRFCTGTVVQVIGQAQGPRGAQFDVIALEGAIIGLSAPQIAPTKEEPLSVTYHDDSQVPETEDHAGVVCFAAGTHIATPDGMRRVETLRPGQLVLTADRGAQPVLWTGRRESLFKRHDNRYRPILFRDGALGPENPTRDLIVSPDHRMLLRGPDFVERFGSPEVLVAARALIGLPRVRPMHGKRRVTYVHVMLENHALLSAEGVMSESFYPDARALAGLNDAQRASLFDVAPNLREATEGPKPVRPIIQDADAIAFVAQWKAARNGIPNSSATFAAE